MAWIRSILLASSFFFISLVSLRRDKHQEDVLRGLSPPVRGGSRMGGWQSYISKVSLRLFSSAACFSLASSNILAICCGGRGVQGWA